MEKLIRSHAANHIRNEGNDHQIREESKHNWRKWLGAKLIEEASELLAATARSKVNDEMTLDEAADVLHVVHWILTFSNIDMVDAIDRCYETFRKGELV